MSLKLQEFSAGYRNWSTGAVSLVVPTHKLTALLGPNGSGKSTLLKGMMGLVRHQGSLQVDGAELAGCASRVRARRLSYLPQRHQFTYPISVEEVILMGYNPEMSLFGHYSQQQRAQAAAVLAQLGLGPLFKADFTSLSEGQKQRIMLARSLVQDTSVLLLDEPDSAMDFGVRHEVLGLIRSIVRTDRRCGLAVLHDPSLALKYCDRIELFVAGNIIDSIVPATDSADSIRQKLERLYGQVALYQMPGGHYIVDLPHEEANAR